MRDFQGKVAVITGAASGIGRALAERAVQAGMKVVLADIEAAALAQAEADLKAAGGEVLAVPTDVSKPDQVAALAQITLDVYGGVHLLCNNAGVGGGSVLTGTLADWQWVMGVNLWGVIYGIHTFIPIMLGQGTEAHIVNTASLAGLTAAGPGIYAVSQHAVVALSETLYQELRQVNARVGVSVLCPGYVKTRIAESARNRPHPTPDAADASLTSLDQAIEQAVRLGVETGMSPALVADQVFQAVHNGEFYILTHPHLKPLIQRRLDDILQGRSPTPAR